MDAKNREEEIIPKFLIM